MTHLSSARVKTIMKSTADVENVSKDSCQLLTKAAELFVRTLTNEAYKDTNTGKKLDYKNIANIVHANERYEFLQEIIPKKITVREYRQLMERKQQSLVSGSSKSDASSSSSDSDSDSEDDDKNKDRSRSSSSGE